MGSFKVLTGLTGLFHSTGDQRVKQDGCLRTISPVTKSKVPFGEWCHNYAALLQNTALCLHSSHTWCACWCCGWRNNSMNSPEVCTTALWQRCSLPNLWHPCFTVYPHAYNKNRHEWKSQRVSSFLASQGNCQGPLGLPWQLQQSENTGLASDGQGEHKTKHSHVFIWQSGVKSPLPCPITCFICKNRHRLRRDESSIKKP